MLTRRKLIWSLLAAPFALAIPALLPKLGATSKWWAVERFNPDGTVSRFWGFSQLKRGDRFRLSDHPVKDRVYFALDNPRPSRERPDQLTITVITETP